MKSRIFQNFLFEGEELTYYKKHVGFYIKFFYYFTFIFDIGLGFRVRVRVKVRVGLGLGDRECFLKLKYKVPRVRTLKF
jgi:hypothetical protein